MMYKRTNILFSLYLFGLFSALPATAEVKYDELCAEGKAAQLPVCKWSDSGVTERGSVLLIHGITQRAWSLNALGTQLASEGYTVYGIDQRGHGRWHYTTKKGETGYSCNFNQSVKDVDKLLPVLKESSPSAPLFLIGESAGAGVAIRSAADSPDMVQGIVLAGTGCKPAPAKFTWVAHDVLTNFYRPNHQIDVVRYQRKYGTDDLVSLEESFKDKWQRPTMSVKELMGVSKFMRQNAKYARRISPTTSVLVIQGCEDKVLRPKSAEKVLASIPSKDKRIVKVENCGHILLGTTHVKPLVSQSISAWLDHGVGATTVASLGTVSE